MVKIGKYNIENFGKPFVIADIAANHMGDLELAKKMIDKVIESGCDCVKFQSWTKNSLFSKMIYESNKDLEDQIDKFSFNLEEFKILKKYCDEKGIMFSTSVFSKEEADLFVDELNMPFIKVASMDVTNLPFLEYLAKKGKPIILSVGLASMAEIDEAVQLIKKHNVDLILLYCVALYPPKDEQVHLNNITLLQEVFDLPVGYSDHTIGTAISLASVAKGSCVVEKHFALDNTTSDIWDKDFSADFEQMKIIVDGSKQIASALGKKQIYLDEANINQRNGMRRSIVYTNNLKANHVVTEEDLDLKRPGTGIQPKHLGLVVGRKLSKDVAEDTLVSWDAFV